MRLKKLAIDGFKNLNTTFNFSEHNSITVLIGNNGSGKSSVLELLSEIFFRIFNDTLDDATFKFELEYEINGTDIKIRKNRVVKYEKKQPTKRTYTTIDIHNLEDYLPSKLIALYSGEELRMWNNYYNDAYKSYMEDIRRNYQGFPTLKLFYINKYYWDIALLTLLYSSLESNIEFCRRILKIDDLNEISVKFEFNRNNLTNFHQNPVVAFIENLSLEQDEKIYKINELQGLEFIGNEREFFLKLMASIMDKNSNYKLINKLTISIDGNLTTSDLSEGEKKQILIKIALEVLTDENSLILFDEPDANIHVANKKQIKNMLDDYTTKEAILTTHSPTLMNIFENNLIYLENGKEKGKEKAEILKEISGDTISDAQKQILLNTNTDILIVEGKTDEKYITIALDKLKNSNEDYRNLEFNFIYMNGSDPENLKKIIEQFQPKTNQTIITFFDNDDAGYNKCIKKAFDLTEEKQDFNGTTQNGIHIYLYPKKDGFENADFEIEDYFKIETLRDFMYDNFRTFQDTKRKFKKNIFAEYCSELEPEEFKGFKKLFDLILEIKGS